MHAGGSQQSPKIRIVYIISRINFNLVPVFTTIATPPPPQTSRTMTDQRGIYYDKSRDPRVNTSTDSGDQPTQKEWIRRPMTSTSNANGLVIAENISDPFICSLVDDEGRPCQGQFSGVINFPYPVASTSTYLQVERLNRFTQHIQKFHKNLQPGSFDTVNGRGRYIASAVAQKKPPPRKGSENRVEGLNAPPIPQDPMTSTILGSSSLKRRQLESVPEEPDESPLAKRSRAAENKHVEKPLNWDIVIANIRAMAKTSNEAAQSAPTEESSRSRAPSESLRPPAAPCDPTPHHDQGLEERFRAIEASLEDKFSQLMDRLHALETRPPPPAAPCDPTPHDQGLEERFRALEASLEEVLPNHGSSPCFGNETSTRSGTGRNSR